MNQAKQQISPSFGTVFADHMLKIVYDISRGGWQYPEITRFENIPLHPAARVLQYASQCFEGLKAYRGVDGKIRLFRPSMNFQRLNRSAERACLPKIDVDLLLLFIKKLICINEKFVPSLADSSLYIRPTLLALDPDLSLGLCESASALLYVITSPCGSYFNNAIRLYADPTYVRAWSGGCGDHKMGANYAPAFYIQKKAKEFKCDQVLWLYGEDEQLTEVGTMSLFVFLINDQGERELVTPPLEANIILPSITRKSLLELCEEWNEFKVTERRITMSELIHLTSENRLLEIFGAGTACVVTPVSEIYYRGNVMNIPTVEQSSPVYTRLFTALTDIQYGRVEHPWTVEVTLDETEERKINS